MVNQDTCPLCKGLNNCQAKNSTQACWCTRFTFSEQLNERIRTLPLSCLCSTCAQSLGARKESEVIHKNE